MVWVTNTYQEIGTRVKHISQNFNTKHHKIARKLPHYFCQFLISKNYYKILQSYQEAYVNFRNFKRALIFKKCKKITSFNKNSKKSYTYFLSNFIMQKYYKTIKKIIRNSWKFIWNFFKKLWMNKGCKKQDSVVHIARNKQKQRIQ
jgi:hypothetical protein